MSKTQQTVTKAAVSKASEVHVCTMYLIKCIACVRVHCVCACVCLHVCALYVSACLCACVCVGGGEDQIINCSWYSWSIPLRKGIHPLVMLDPQSI